MLSIASERRTLDRHPDRFTVEALAEALPQRWLVEAIAESGRCSQRVRQLPDVLTAWAVILMGLFRRLSYASLLEFLFEAGQHRGLWAGSGAPTPSALVKARDRLGAAPMRRLFERSVETWLDAVPGTYVAGRRVFAMDGSTLKVPDTPGNRAHFGLPGSDRGRAAYPQLRMVNLRDAGSRISLAVRTGPYRTGELDLARSLVESVPAGSVVLMDRAFMSYDLIHDLHERGVDFVVRARSIIKSEVVAQLGPADAIVRVHLPRYWRARRPDLPRTWLLREVRYLPQKGVDPIRLFTSLMLTEALGGKQLAELYPQRWQEETAYDEIKTHQLESTTITRPTHLRSQTPERIEQELYGLLIAHNATRLLMAQAAEAADEHPHRISFSMALARIREAVRDMMLAATRRLPERFARLLAAIARALVPRRPGRSAPRAVKIKMSGYPLRRDAMA